MKEKNKNILVSITAGLPTIGGPLSVLLDKYIPREIEERRKSIINDIVIAFEEIDNQRLNKIMANKSFISIFIKCIKAAIEEHVKEKQKCFKNIIINIAKDNEEFDYDEISLFINIILRLTSDQVSILKSVMWDEEIFTSKADGLAQVFQDKYPEMDEGYLMYCVSDLQRDLLCGSMEKYKKIRGGTILSLL